MKPWKITELVDHDVARFYRTEDNVVVAEYLEEDLILEEEDAKVFQASLKGLCRDNKNPVLLIPSKGFQPTAETRDFAAEPENMEYVTACAVIVKNLALRLTVNFFNRFYKPAIPFKLFENELEGYNWLLENHPAQINRSNKAS
jgi:hypothetical protein